MECLQCGYIFFDAYNFNIRLYGLGRILYWVIYNYKLVPEILLIKLVIKGREAAMQCSK